MFEAVFEEKVDDISGIDILAYKIGNEISTRSIISIHQTKNTDDDVEPSRLYLDVSTTKKLITLLQRAILRLE